MKVTRADWAASTPWGGITGKPDFANGTQGPRGLTGPQGPRGPAGVDGDSGYEEFFFPWNPPAIKPLQSCWEDFPAIGFSINQIVDVGPPYNVTGCIFTGFVPDNDAVRLQVQNITLSDVDLGNGVWRVRIYN